MRPQAVGVVVGIVAVAALSGVGGATAASLITSKQIKNGTITSVDVKDASLKIDDLSGSTRSALSQAGPVGPSGPVGPEGEAGSAGASGPRGDIGSAGPAGPAGAAGAAGPTGETGPTGPTGSIGPKGETGAIGAVGPTGDAGPVGPSGPQGPQGAAGVSNVITVAIPAGSVITPEGTILGQVTLSSQNNYVVSAGVTALANVNDALQCQLISTRSPSWDDLGEANVTARATIPLEHAYPRTGAFTTHIAYVACRSASAQYVVDTGHLYAWQVGSLSSAGSGHVISRAAERDLTWEPMG